MPKTNDGGATAAGFSGVVEHGAPLPDGRMKSELDPELNLDGTLIEGDHPDHAKSQERDANNLPIVQEPIPVERDQPDENFEDENESAGGTSEDESDDGAAVDEPVRARRTKGRTSL